AQARKERSLRQRFVAVAVVAGLFALVSGGLGWLAQNYAGKVKGEAHNAKNALIEGNQQRKVAEAETKGDPAQGRVGERRRLTVLSDLVRPSRLDQAMLLAVEASDEDTLDARGCLLRCLDTRPEVSRFCDMIPEGDVTSVAFGPGGVIATGYGRGRVVGGV